jgi:hypothetical protein
LAACVASGGCSSPDAREALIEAATVTALAVGAAAMNAATEHDPTRESTHDWNQRPHHVPDEPGVWRLIRNPDGDDECDPERDNECTSEPEPEQVEPFVETGNCIVCH